MSVKSSGSQHLMQCHQAMLRNREVVFRAIMNLVNFNCDLLLHPIFSKNVIIISVSEIESKSLYFGLKFWKIHIVNIAILV